MRIPQEMVNHFSEFAKPGDEVVIPYSEGIRTVVFLLDAIWAAEKEPAHYNDLILAMNDYANDKSEATCLTLCGALVDYLGSLSGPLGGAVKYATGLSCVDACVNANCENCGEK